MMSALLQEASPPFGAEALAVHDSQQRACPNPLQATAAQRRRLKQLHWDKLKQVCGAGRGAPLLFVAARATLCGRRGACGPACGDGRRK